MVNVNLIGNIHLFNLFMPLVLRGDVKKVVTISTGMADTEMVRKYDIFESPLYSISKAAMNMAIAKFSAEYAKQGVLFLGISPGVVDSGTYSESESSFLRPLFFPFIRMHWREKIIY